MTNILNQYTEQQSYIIELEMEGSPNWNYYHLSVVLHIFFTLGFLYLIVESYIKNDFDLLSFLVIAILITYQNYQFFQRQQWLKHGKEKIKIGTSQLEIIKYKNGQKLRMHTIQIAELKNIEYCIWSTRLPPFLPYLDDGNITITTKDKRYSIAINFNQKECELLIQHLKFVLKIPEIVY
jgi:hypothetical protein